MNLGMLRILVYDIYTSILIAFENHTFMFAQFLEDCIGRAPDLHLGELLRMDATLTLMWIGLSPRRAEKFPP